MSLGTATAAILDQVREVTDTPVEIVEDASLQVLAVVTTARPGIPFHLIRVNPSLGNADYVVSYQCGFLLRQAALSTADRWQFGLSSTGLASVKKLLSGPGGVASRLGIPSQAVDQLAQQLVSGILVQLRSMPIGMRIDRWIYNDYPDLHESQSKSLRSQCQDNLQTLSPSVREMTPASIWRANVSLNSAYALNAARLLDDPTVTVPYEAAGFTAEGRNIMEIVETEPADPTTDRAMVNQIGTTLGLSDWYQFLPVEANI